MPEAITGSPRQVCTRAQGQMDLISAQIWMRFKWLSDFNRPQTSRRVVSVSATPTQGSAALTVNFLSSAADPDGSIASYSWNFGDGQTSVQPSPSHVYQTPGTFTAQLTVTDNGGATASASVTITVTGANPTPAPDNRNIVLYASEASVKVGNWQVVADATRSRRQSHIQSGCGAGESRHSCRKSGELFRDDLHCAGRHALSLLDERQGAEQLSIQRLCSRAVLRQREPERGGNSPHRHYIVSRDEPGRMQRVRVVADGAGRITDGE